MIYGVIYGLDFNYFLEIDLVYFYDYFGIFMYLLFKICYRLSEKY